MQPQQGLGRAAAVARLWESAPKEELKFLMQSAENPWPKHYLCILYVLDEAYRRGTGYMGYEDLARRSVELVEGFTGEVLDEAGFERRVRQMEQWGLVERSTERDASIPLSRWSHAGKRQQLTKQGLLVVELVERAAAAKEDATGAQDARQILTDIGSALAEVRRLLDAEGDHHANLREAYIRLQRVSKEHKSLTDYLRDLHINLLDFGIKNEGISSGLGPMLDRLETYMTAIHREFRAQSRSITASCRDLQQQQLLDRLLLGCQLTRSNDQNEVRDVPRPNPEDLLAQLLAFFDGNEIGSLSSEVDRVGATCSLIVSRLRLHYQNITERTQNLQMLQLGWQRLKDLEWEDQVGWQRALLWGHHLLALRSIQTAPNLGTPEAPGKPPEPRRRLTLRSRIVHDVKVQVAPMVDFEDRHLDERLEAMDALARRILDGRSRGQLQDVVAIASHDEFRLLLELVFHCVTQSHLAHRLAWSIEFAPGMIQWSRDGMTYLFPNASIHPRLEVTHAH